MTANLSLFDYRWAIEMRGEDPPFYGLLGALILKADSDNFEKIRAMWPEEVADFERRYHSPGGLLPGEKG